MKFEFLRTHPVDISRYLPKFLAKDKTFADLLNSSLFRQRHGASVTGSVLSMSCRMQGTPTSSGETVCS